MLTFFDDLAEFEREFIRPRTGRKLAKAKSVKFGRSAAHPTSAAGVIRRLAEGCAGRSRPILWRVADNHQQAGSRQIIGSVGSEPSSKPMRSNPSLAEILCETHFHL
jgi:DNA invertase Pin-like site-specific DNA recombinase